MKKPNSAKIIALYCPLFIIIYNLTGNLSNDIYLPTLPILSAELNAGSFLTQFTMTIWFLGVAIPQIYFGLIADRIGYRPLMLYGSLLFLLATLLCFLSPNIYILLIGRFFQGVAVSSLNIATFATVSSRHYPEQKGVKFISWINITGSLAPLIGPPLGSVLFQFFGWRSTFGCMLFLGTLSTIGLYFFMLESRECKIDFKINFSSSYNYYKQAFNKKLFLPLITYISFLGAMIVYLTTAPLIIYHQFHIPVKYFGLTQLFPFTLFILGGLSANKLINHYSTQKIISIGLMIIFASVIYFASIMVISAWLSVYNYILAISCFLYSFALFGSSLLAKALASSTNKGGASALVGLCMATSATIASLLTAIFYQGHFNHAGVIFCLFIVIGILNCLFSKRIIFHDQ